MPNITMPKFSAIRAATPQEVMPTGAVIGTALGSSLGTLSASWANNQQQKKAILGMAEVVGETDPQTAAQYRSLADSIPAFSLPSLGGVGGGGSSGGLGNQTGAVMDSMLDLLKISKQSEAAMALDNQRTKNDLLIETVNHRNTIEEILAKSKVKEDADIRKEEAAQKQREFEDRWNRAKDDTERAKLGTGVVGSAIQLEVEKQRSENSKRELDGSLAHAAAMSEQAKARALQAAANVQTRSSAAKAAASMTDSQVESAIRTSGNSKYIQALDDVDNILEDSSIKGQDRRNAETTKATILKAARESLATAGAAPGTVPLQSGSYSGRVLGNQ